MLTRRSFLAALVVSPVASKAVPLAAPVAAPLSQGAFIAAMEADILKCKREMIRRLHQSENRAMYLDGRRDDGDTILELR